MILSLRITLLAGAITVPTLCYGQSAPVFTGPSGAPAVAGDPIKRLEVIAAIQDRVNVTGGASTNQTLTSPVITSGTADNPFSFLNPTPTLDTQYAAGGLTNGVIIAAGGNQISYCPVLSCITSPTSDHQRTSALFWSTTTDDGHSEEQTVGIETIIKTGYFKNWAVNTAYAIGDNVEFQDERNSVYRAITAGTSASSGTGPSGTGSSISDGSVVWMWINAAAINGKVGWYSETVVLDGGGNGWAMAANMQIQPGTRLPYASQAAELDYTNNSGSDCTIGSINCYDLLLVIKGTNKATAGLNVGGRNGGSSYSAEWGIWLNGDHLAATADIEDDSSGPVGLLFGRLLAASHSIATIQDYSTGLTGIQFVGTKTGTDMSSVSTSPAAFSNSGIHPIATFVDVSNSASVFNLSGDHESGTMADYSTGSVGIQFLGTKTHEDIGSTSSSPAMFSNSGVHSNATFVDVSNSPSVFNIDGNHANQTFADTSVTPSALNLAGTYSLAAISTVLASTPISLEAAAGQKVCFNGINNCVQYFATTGKYYFTNASNIIVASLSDGGAFITSGPMTQNGTP